MWVTADNFVRVREDIPADQAERLIPGCETWGMEPVPGVKGRITIWPEGHEAAVSWGGGSFWGIWHAKDDVVELNEAVHGFTLAVTRDGTLWAVMTLEMFRHWYLNQFLAKAGVDDQRGVAETRLAVKVGCSILPIYRGREMIGILEEEIAELKDHGGGIPLQ